MRRGQFRAAEIRIVRNIRFSRRAHLNTTRAVQQKGQCGGSGSFGPPAARAVGPDEVAFFFAMLWLIIHIIKCGLIEDTVVCPALLSKTPAFSEERGSTN